MTKWLLAFVSLCAAFMLQIAHAQTWPQRPVRMIVPFAAGGNTDIQARIVSESLSAVFGQQFLVENRVGAGGAIGTEFVAKAPADGYTLLFGPVSVISILPLVQKVNYAPLKDFAPVSVLGTNPFMLSVHVSLPVKNLKEFIDYVKARPGQLNYASAGAGTVSHLTPALFLARAGLKMTHVAYKGGAPAATDLVGGQVQMLFGVPLDLVPHARSGKIRLLAVSSEKRMSQFPELPAVAEFYPGFRTVVWNGLLAAAGTPKEIVDRLAQEVIKATREPGVIERLNKIGVDPLGNAPAEFAALIKSDAPLWREAVNAAGLNKEQ